MKFEIGGNPDFGDLTVALAPGESVWAESGAMSRMSANLQVQSRLIGGFVKALWRKVVGGESLFVGEYTASDVGFVAFAPSAPGSILHRRLENETFHLTAGSFLACSPGLTFRTRFGGLRALFSGEGGFFLEVTGAGDLFFSSYGGVLEREIDGDFIVDTGHLVAWEPSLQYNLAGMGGWKQTLFSGEGITLRFTGKGKIFLQSRHLNANANWLSPFCLG